MSNLNRHDPFDRRGQLNRLRPPAGQPSFHDEWERNFDKNFNRAAKWGPRLVVGVILANLIVWGVVIWAIIELVQWLTSK